MKVPLPFSFTSRSPTMFLLLRTLGALLFTGLFVFVIQRDLPSRIVGIKNARLQQQTALAQIQATADLKKSAARFSPIILKLEAVISTDELAFSTTQQIRSIAQQVFAGQGKVDVGQPVPSADVSGLRQVPLTIEGDGNIQTIHTLLRQLHAAPTFIRVTSISAVSSGDVQEVSRIRVTTEFFLRQP